MHCLQTVCEYDYEQTLERCLQHLREELCEINCNNEIFAKLWVGRERAMLYKYK
jgi:hypothetical protein